MTRRQRVLLWLGIFAAIVIAALIATASQPPRPACSDAYSPACATPYQEEP